jgi:hypothetical protein
MIEVDKQLQDGADADEMRGIEKKRGRQTR